MKTDFLIVGLGKTGLSCARYLKRIQQSFQVFDTRQSPPGLEDFLSEFPGVTVHQTHFPEVALSSIHSVVVSPSLSPADPVLQPFYRAGIKRTSELDLFMASVNAPVVGITGTNGKSTVTAWVGDMVNAAGKTPAVCGNIGWPMLDALCKHWGSPPDFYVVELSSFQLEHAEHCPMLSAVLLNCSDDHQDRHKDLQEYRQIKKKIYDHVEIPVLNADAPALWQGVSHATSCFYFSETYRDGEQDFALSDTPETCYLTAAGRRVLAAEKLRVVGRHQWTNALACMALAKAMALPEEAVLASLKRFAGLPHRCQWVAERFGVHWYNDSKATNVGACLAAVSSLSGATSGRLGLLLGGDGKGADFSVLKEALSGKVDHVFLYGQDAEAIEAGIAQAVPVAYANHLVAAVSQAAQWAAPGDKVLLSPACASYDEFANFEERGCAFQEAVEAL